MELWFARPIMAMRTTCASWIKRPVRWKLDEQGRSKPKTAHSLNPVPAIVYDPSGAANARLADVPGAGIANLAATCITLLGFEPPEDYAASLVEVG